MDLAAGRVGTHTQVSTDQGFAPVSDAGTMLFVRTLCSEPLKLSAFLPSRLLVKVGPAPPASGAKLPPSDPAFAHCATGAPSTAVTESAERSTSSVPADRKPCVMPGNAHAITKTKLNKIVFISLAALDMSRNGTHTTLA